MFPNIINYSYYYTIAEYVPHKNTSNIINLFNILINFSELLILF